MIPSEEERQQLVAESSRWIGYWLQNVEPGAAHVYHVGWLMTDRLTDPTLDAVANAFLAASEYGLVELKQRRIGDMRMEYIAQRRASE